MYISEISAEFNIPVKNIISFLISKGIDANVHKILTVEEEAIIRKNIEEIRSSVTISNIELNKLNGPKILGKISLPLSNNKVLMKENTTPRLLAAAKQFNVGMDTIIEHLVSKGFDRDYLKPTVKITEEMYISLVERFEPDRLQRFKNDLIQFPKSSDTGEQNYWMGVIDDISDNEKVKIIFISNGTIVKNNKPLFIERIDKDKWIYAFRDNWISYNFKLGDVINFSIQQIDKGNRKVRVAVPLSEKISEKNLNFKNLSAIIEQSSHDSVKIDLKKEINMESSNLYFQKILFGSPGTGKSHTIDGAENSYLNQLLIFKKSPDCIKTVFHPEYTYGDFMGKLMPYTNDDGQVEYRFYAGHFLKAMGRAYKNIILSKIEYEKSLDEAERIYKREINKNNKKEFNDLEIIELQSRRDKVQIPKPKNVALVIDEINRGNSAAIFGTIFQLLDREENGWSSYHVTISDLEYNELLKEISLEYKEYKKQGKVDEISYRFDGFKCTESEYNRFLDFIFEDLPDSDRIKLHDRNIKIPSNFSVIATMNTSDNSIYFMDSAFKRRWDWEFIDVTSEGQKQQQVGRILEDNYSWVDFIDNINSFIKKYGERIRKIEDKQIGYYFIKGNVIKHDAIKNKLMFFLWDSIFSNDKKPLRDLMGSDITLITFGDFTRNYDLFLNAIKTKSFLQNNVL